MMKMRFFVDVLLPPPTTGSRGERQGADTVLMENVPCSIESISGREAEVAHQLVASATHTVEMRGPIPGLTPVCKLGEHPKDTAGKYKSMLDIGHVADPTRTGREYKLLVTERLA